MNAHCYSVTCSRYSCCYSCCYSFMCSRYNCCHSFNCACYSCCNSFMCCCYSFNCCCYSCCYSFRCSQLEVYLGLGAYRGPGAWCPTWTRLHVYPLAPPLLPTHLLPQVGQEQGKRQGGLRGLIHSYVIPRGSSGAGYIYNFLGCT